MKDEQALPVIGPETQPQAALAARPGSWIDLRAFALDAGQGITSPASMDDRFQTSRRFIDFPPGPVSAGAISLTGGEGVVSYQQADEFVIVNEGTISFTQAGRKLTLSAGDSSVIPEGAEFSWSAAGPVSAIFMRYRGSQSKDSSILAIDKTPQLEPSGSPLADLLLTPAPKCRNQTDYRSSDGNFTCGTWDSTPYHRLAMSYGHYELMHLLGGSVTFVDETGRSVTFSEGDIFLIEQGARCSWESREPVTKVYAIYRKA